MTIQEIRKKAKAIGVKANGGKSELIRRIQQAEGNDVCFGSRQQCSQMGCCWRDVCLK